MNRLTSEAGPFGTTVTVSYDSLGRLTNASFSGHTWTYQYDALSRITNILAPEGIYRLGYHEQGLRKTSVQYPNSVTASMTYDSLIRMTNLAYSVGASNLLSIRYGYDNGDRRSSEVWGDGRSLTYVYDRAHQLLDSVSTSRASDNASYRYDKAGNPLRRSEMGLGITNSFNNLNQIVAGIWTGGAITVSGAVNYNAGTVTVNGVTANRFGMFYEKTNVSLTAGTNLITAVYHGPGFTNHPNIVTAQTQVVVGQAAYTHDPNGNLTADANLLYRYDALNQLTNVVTKLGATNLLANRYDGLGRRVQATTGGTNIVRYVYLPGTFLVLATLDGANNLLETFTHGPDLSGTLGGAGGIGGILSQTKHHGQSTTHFLHSDAMGNVILTTDESATVSSSYRYTPFGRPYAKTGPFTSRFTYSSKEFDGATGLGYWGYRFYSPGLGRWVNRDPIGEEGGINLYEITGNDAVNNVDMLGLNTYRVNKCEAFLFIGHMSENDPLVWDMDQDCAVAGAVGCFPRQNNPSSNSHRWPNVPTHGRRMLDGALGKGIADRYNALDDIGGNRMPNDPRSEHDFSKAVPNALSEATRKGTNRDIPLVVDSGTNRDIPLVVDSGRTAGYEEGMKQGCGLGGLVEWGGGDGGAVLLMIWSR